MHIVEGHGHSTQIQQNSLRESMRKIAVKITAAIPFVVSAVQPNGDCPARLQQTGQTLERPFAIRCMVQHAKAVKEIEAFGYKGERKNIRSKKVCARLVGKVPGSHLVSFA